MATTPEAFLPPSLRQLPVVLMGGTNLVRSLGRAGIPAIVATADPDEPAIASRYCHAHCPLPSYAEPEAVVQALVALGQRIATAFGRRAPLMYGSDDALELIHAHRERLERYFLLLLNPPEVGDALIDKDRFQAFATARGLPVPRSLDWAPGSPNSVAAMAGPVLVKPKVKVDWYESPLRAKLFDGEAKARVFATGSAAAQDPVVARFHDQLLFQEYIPGDDTSLWSYHAFADEHGRVLASFVGRKIRTHPPLTGESAFIELAHDESLEEVGRGIAARVPLRGAFKMDFKRDTRDGSWRLLEVNARYNLWHYLGTANGVNLLRVAYDHLVDGMAPPPMRAATTYRWLSLEHDWHAFRALAARGQLAFGRWLASVVFSRNVYNVFAWHDPGPWLRFWQRRLTRRLHRGPARVLQVFRTWRSTPS